MDFSTLKRPSALIPLAMSLAALALVLGHIAMFGGARHADEGAAAHLWQLLMAGQMPIIAFFAIKWLPRTPRQALLVLVLQAGAGVAAASPVFLLKLLALATRRRATSSERSMISARSCTHSLS